MESTFVIKIMYTQNATWQGTVSHICPNGKQETQHFRSALELIRLIDDSMSDESRSSSKGEAVPQQQ